MRCGVVFYHRRWHVGITDGHDMIDSRMRQGGVARRELEPGYLEIEWLDPELGARVWARAVSMVGEPYRFCSAFVCECLGGMCVLPGDVRPQLEAARASQRDQWMDPYRKRREDRS